MYRYQSVRFTLIFLFFMLFNISTYAVDCDPCEPLAEVGITNKGLEKLIQVSMTENLKVFNQTVKNRAGFKDLVLDKSKCPTQTISQAWNNRKKDNNCYGLPELKDDFTIGGSTPLRPYRADVDQFRLNHINLALAGPVKCENFKCDFDVQIKDLLVDGRLQLNYTDKPESFVPPTAFSISTSEKANMKFSGQILVDPKTGQLNDLVFLNDEKSKVQFAAGSLNLDMDLKKPFPSKDVEQKMRANAFRRFVDLKKVKSAEFIEQQYQSAISTMEFQYRVKNSTQKMSLKEEVAQAKVAVQDLIIAKYGSQEKFKQSLQNINWPDPQDDAAINSFLAKPPAEVSFFPGISENIHNIDLAAQAENAGFTNYQAYMMTLLSVKMTNMAGSDPFMVENIIEPLLQKEIVPTVQSEVNTELRNLKQYWDQIAKVPTLNTQDLERIYALQKKLINSTSETDKEQIRREIIELTKKAQDNWLAIDTQVLVDQNTRQGQLLKSQIFKSSPNCSSYPKKFSDDTETDFDLRTEIGPNALQTYFNELAANKKLNLCVDSKDEKTCQGGIKVNFKSPPKVSCENGELALEVDADVAKSIFNVGVAGKLKAKIKNCGGDPCMEFTDSQGRLKNAVLNTFFGSFLQRGLSSALNQSSNVPVNIPFVKLDKLQTSPKDCKTKLDWEIRP